MKPILHTCRVKEAEKDAQRRAAKKRERDNDRKAKLDAVDRHAEKACIAPSVNDTDMLFRARQQLFRKHLHP